MATINISVPDDMRDWVEEVVKSHGYQTTSEYFRELVRRDQRARAESRLEEMLLEGLESGDGIEITPEYWERKRKELIERFRPRKKHA